MDGVAVAVVVHIPEWPRKYPTLGGESALQQRCKRCRQVLIDATDGRTRRMLEPGRFVAIPEGGRAYVMDRDAALAGEEKCTDRLRKARQTWQ